MELLVPKAVPKDVRERIWAFAWHLKLGRIREFQHHDSRSDPEFAWKEHYIWVVAASEAELPVGIHYRAYLMRLGVPTGFNPREPTVQIYRNRQGRCGFSIFSNRWRYDTVAGIETWAEVVTEEDDNYED